MTNPNTERDDANTDALTAAAAAIGAAQHGGDVSDVSDVSNDAARSKQGAAPAYEGADVRERDFSQVQVGWSVFSSDGEELGKVSTLGPNWFAVPYGTTDEYTMYIPVTYLETIGNQRVVLSQPAGLLIDMKLNQPPADFPGEYERTGGIDHQPWRGEVGERSMAEPADRPAQTGSEMPPGGTSGLSGERGGGATMSASSGVMTMQSAAGTMVMDAGRSSQEMRLRADAALQPAAPWDDQSAAFKPSVEATVTGDLVSRSEGRDGFTSRQRGVSTRMTSLPTAGSGRLQDQVNAENRSAEAFEQRSGYISETSNLGFDLRDGPTAQAGVRDQRTYEPLRTPFGEMGTPGEGKERNVRDLDLSRNHHPEGSAFDSQASTVGRPLAPGEPSIANRSVPSTQGGADTTGAQDVPQGAVSRPAPEGE